MVQGPLHGDARSSHGISVKGEAVAQKIDAWDSTPISHPRVMSLQSLEEERWG